MWSFETTGLEGVVVITPPVYVDDRGFFQETFNVDVFREHGIAHPFMQDNHSLSRAVNTLRGIHFQTDPMAQAKLVRCIRGALLDVAVDLRRSSPTFGRWEMVELSAENRKQLYIPVGFGHAFLTIEPNSELAYKVSGRYSKPHDSSVHWKDPDIGIDWPIGEEDAVLSEKDAKAPTLAAAPVLYD